MMLTIQLTRLIKIDEAARILGVTEQTLRRREKSGQLLPDKKTEGGTHYYDIDRLMGTSSKTKESSLIYA